MPYLTYNQNIIAMTSYTKYSLDRGFTDYVHKIAISKVYSNVGWIQQDIDSSALEYLDVHKGIDYLFKAKDGSIKSVQERFREKMYANYSDFTIRYRRDENPNKDRVKSEYYKMAADYFTYGITNGNKSDFNTVTNFLKVAIIDLKKVYQKIDESLIVIRKNNQKVCRIITEDGERKIECPVLYNRDHSSSFFPIDIKFLIQLWGNEMVVYKDGF